MTVAEAIRPDMHPDAPRLVVVAGNTATAEIEGITAAGASPGLIAHTPAADAEILAYGEVVAAPATAAAIRSVPFG